MKAVLTQSLEVFVDRIPGTLGMRLWACVVLLLLPPSARAGSNEKFIQRDVASGAGLNLEDFGGPHIIVALAAAEPTFISAHIADHTQLVPVAQTNIQGGTSSVVMMPTRKGIKIEKRNGMPCPGSRSEMYLLYDDKPSGLRVYFLDAIAPQNHHTLVVRVPPPPLPPPPQPAVPTTSASIEPSRQPGDGVISSELLAWYLKIQQARQSLDTTNAEAVAQFNRHAADYHAALKKARETK
jgi:hypothetical protein